MSWNRRKVLLFIPIVVLFVSVVGGWALNQASDDVDANLTTPGSIQEPTIGTNAKNTGKKFPFVEVANLATGENGTISPAGKPMVINFWFSTCEPCKREMPALSAAAITYGSKVDFIGINPNDSETSANAFLKKYKITYANYLDDGDQLAEAGIATLPATFFIDADGTIVSRHTGELTEADITDQIENKLKVS